MCCGPTSSMYWPMFQPLTKISTRYAPSARRRRVADRQAERGVVAGRHGEVELVRYHDVPAAAAVSGTGCDSHPAGPGSRAGASRPARRTGRRCSAGRAPGRRCPRRPGCPGSSSSIAGAAPTRVEVVAEIRPRASLCASLTPPSSLCESLRTITDEHVRRRRRAGAGRDGEASRSPSWSAAWCRWRRTSAGPR